MLAKDDALDALKSPDFEVTPHIAFAESLVERLGIDLTVTLAVMRKMPIWVKDADHDDLRRKVALFLAANRDEKMQRAEDRIRSGIASALQAEGDLDLRAMIAESVDILMEEVTGISPALPDGERLPCIFSSDLGVGARKRLEAGLRKLRDATRDRFPQEDAETHLLRIGQWLMGRDPLLGMASLTLFHHLQALGGQPMSMRPMEHVPTHTGVPAIGRISRKSATVSGHELLTGDLVECRLDSLNGCPAAMRQNFFGVGEHLCLGRPLALRFFTILRSALSQCAVGLTVQSFSLVQHDVFDVPSVFTARKQFNPEYRIA